MSIQDDLITRNATFAANYNTPDMPALPRNSVSAGRQER